MTSRLMPAGLLLGAALALLAAHPPPASADKLAIEAPTLSADMKLPRRGSSMASVERRFGAPRERRGPVGDPPISRWIYDDFTVYFEGDRVIHTVVRRRTSGGAGQG